jgi:hypothetical protein
MALCCAALSMSRPASADDAVPGAVVLARASSDALLIWDASDDVAAIVKDKASDADANARLERDAVRVLASHANEIGKSAKTITLRVIYSKTGAVSPVYGTPTFLGTERYATLSADAAPIADDRDRWKESDGKLPAPGWLTWKVLGRLPPR